MKRRAKSTRVGSARRRSRSNERPSKIAPAGLSAEVKLCLLEDLVPKLARAIAPICEVVLHENISDPPTIRAIGNGHITGRSVGDLMTHIVVDGEDLANRRTPLFNYISRTPAGNQLRVSLIPILHDNKVIAYVAVNFLVQDLNAAKQALSFLVQAEDHVEAIRETFLTPHDVIDRTVEESLHVWGRPAAHLQKRERVELVRRLRDRGAFGMRGAVDEVATKLGVSRTAIYNYIRELDGRSSGK